MQQSHPVQLVVKTTTNIDPAEISMVLDKGLKLLSDLAIDAGYASLYDLKNEGVCTMKLLYLYLYAIQSWRTEDQAMNYMTQDDLISLLSRVEQLFYIVQTKRAC